MFGALLTQPSFACGVSLIVARCTGQHISLHVKNLIAPKLYTFTMPRIKRSAASSRDDAQPSAKKPKLTESDSSTETFSSEACTIDGKKWNFKIVSWNVNGVRAWLNKDGLAIFKNEDPDIICLQETKCNEGKIPKELNVAGYTSYLMSAKKEGYSGVAILSKVKPLSVVKGIADSKHDCEGRCLTAEYEQFYLVTAYVPNAGRGLVTLDKRIDWDPKLLQHLKELDAKKPVILCGDLNVSHKEIDLANPKSNQKNAGFTKEERAGFTTLLEAGFIDSFRHLYPEKTEAYTFWSYMMNARAKNIGWRLDYFVLSERMKESLCDSVIRSSVQGSDHCPITLLLHFDEQRT